MYVQILSIASASQDSSEGGTPQNSQHELLEITEAQRLATARGIITGRLLSLAFWLVVGSLVYFHR